MMEMDMPDENDPVVRAGDRYLDWETATEGSEAWTRGPEVISHFGPGRDGVVYSRGDQSYTIPVAVEEWIKVFSDIEMAGVIGTLNSVMADCQRERARATEAEESRDEARRLGPLCEKHGTGSGWRTGCLVCGLIEQSYALSRIEEALTGESVGLFDIGAGPESVVSVAQGVQSRLEEIEKVVRSLLEGPAVCDCDEAFTARGRHEPNAVHSDYEDDFSRLRELFPRDSPS